MADGELAHGAAREGRGFGTPEKWMPWVTTNHLYSTAGLEQFDPKLFSELSARPRANWAASRPVTKDHPLR